MAIAFVHIRGAKPWDAVRARAAVCEENGKRDKSNGNKGLHLDGFYGLELCEYSF